MSMCRQYYLNRSKPLRKTHTPADSTITILRNHKEEEKQHHSGYFHILLKPTAIQRTPKMLPLGPHLEDAVNHGVYCYCCYGLTIPGYLEHCKCRSDSAKYRYYCVISVCGHPVPLPFRPAPTDLRSVRPADIWGGGACDRNASAEV